MTEKNVTDVTSNLPTMEPETASRVKKVAVTAAAVLGGLLALDEGVKRFRNRKKVEVVVTNVNPES